MSLALRDQAREALERSENILIVPAHDFSGDAIGSAFGLGAALEKQGKRPSVFMPQRLPQKLSFLQPPGSVVHTLPREHEFTVVIDTREAPIQDLRYEKDESVLKIYLTTSSHLSKDHIALQRETPRQDLIVTISAPDLEALGEAFTRNPSLFLDTPILNIDHQPSNERFGKINLVDLGASTSAEIVSEFLEYWNSALIDEPIATALLAGILDGTRGFQLGTVSPKTLTSAAHLIARGARREQIIQYLYKTREIGFLKLWGRVMTRLEVVEHLGVAYAGILDEDFLNAGVGRETLPLILEDLQAHFGAFAAVALYWKDPDAISFTCLLLSHDERLAGAIEKRLNTKRAGFLLTFPLEAQNPQSAQHELLQIFTSVAEPAAPR